MAVEKLPVENPVLYAQETAALLAELTGNFHFRKALAEWCAARHRGAGETMLFPSVTADQLQIIRGKAQLATELMQLCKKATQKQLEEAEKGEQP